MAVAQVYQVLIPCASIILAATSFRKTLVIITGRPTVSSVTVMTAEAPKALPYIRKKKQIDSGTTQHTKDSRFLAGEPKYFPSTIVLFSSLKAILW